ncbi:MAG TPA: YccF domain-containing protein [Galbitalea sp.]
MQPPAILELKTGPSMLIRAIWYLLIGWWLSAIYMAIGYGLFLTVLGIPLGLLMVNRLPFVFSLHRGYA